MDYNKMVKFLEKCPNTWVPALFLVALNRCVRDKVFVDIMKVVSSARATILKEEVEAAKQSGEAPNQQLKDSISHAVERYDTACKMGYLDSGLIDQLFADLRKLESI